MTCVLSSILPVRHELDTCLFSVIATILRHRGWNDIMSLGANWNFHYPVQSVRRTEYFFPVQRNSLLETLLPEQGVTSSWRITDETDRAWMDLVAAVCAGRPTAVAVDNYYLPFRPAYHDVHSNHLIVVYGVDQDRDLVFVLDATPPAFMGPIDVSHLCRARSSTNPAVGERDYFFSRSPIAHAQLDISFPDDPWFPTRETIRIAIERNLLDLHKADDDPMWLKGISGMHRLADLVECSKAEHHEDIFIVSGSLLASRARHSVFLRRAAAMLRIPRLREIGRELEVISHQWAAARILASREIRARPENARARLAARLRRIGDAEANAARHLEGVGM